MEIEVKCSCCSKGCNLKIDEESLVVVGNSCPRGVEYGINEVSYLQYNKSKERREPVMEIRKAAAEDFDLAFDYIEKLWTYNTYDREVIRKVYNDVLANDNDFAFFLFDDGKPKGFCHGTFFNTFWLSGPTCYISSIITNQEERKKGYGAKMMDHVKDLAKERGCHAIVLDSGMPRTEAHRFYETYGFDKCAYCFELKLDQ